jgi:hypothetical protein
MVGALALRLEAWPRSSVRADDLMAEMIAVSPELATSPGRFARLADALDALASAGVVVPSKRTVVRQGVPLPSSCRIARPAPAAIPQPAISHPWVPILSWCADRRWRDPSVYERVVAVNAWLAQNSNGARPVPIRERSLEITGDDKALERLLDGPLNRGQVFEALAVRRVHPPMAVARVPDATGNAVLIVENGTPYHSVHEAACYHAAAGRPVAWRWIGYGAGGQISAILPSLRVLGSDQLAYFGDLDPEGLDFAAGGDEAARACGLDGLRMHPRLYEALITTGRPQRKPHPRPWSGRGLAWLGELAPVVSARLGGELWLAQEWVGLRWLLDDVSWLSPVHTSQRGS